MFRAPSLMLDLCLPIFMFYHQLRLRIIHEHFSHVTHTMRMKRVSFERRPHLTSHLNYEIGGCFSLLLLLWLLSYCALAQFATVECGAKSKFDLSVERVWQVGVRAGVG